MAAVNSITFVDENRRFISTSDDKTIRVWDWGFPVVIKYIADPTMHSVPAVAVSPNSTACSEASQASQLELTLNNDDR